MREYTNLTKPTPEHYCAYCGTKMERKQYPSGKSESIPLFLRRKYCNRECMRKAFVRNESKEQKWGAAHATARKITYLIGEREKKCELCGSTKSVDVHHKDGDYRNNSPENLMTVCRSCHMKLHRPIQKVCVVCGKECKRTHNGMCDKHYFRWKKYGDPFHKPWSTYTHRQKTESEEQQLSLF